MKTFGGYFPLELPVAGSHYYSEARTYRSARSALFHLLTIVRPTCIWLPRLICQSVIDAVNASGVEMRWYALDEDYYPCLPQPFGVNDCLLYVDYLGHCQAQKQRIAAQFPPERIIFDHSQAFYAHQAASLANLYSPRKFFGVADGGLLDTPCASARHRFRIMTPFITARIFCRSMSSIPGQAIAIFSRPKPRWVRSMPAASRLTDRLLRGVDYAEVKAVRERNYRILSARLSDLNAFAFSDETVSGPFCYPFYFPTRSLHQALIARGVFVATYWREALERVDANSVEAHFVNNMIPLPC
jgi:hypothetical protein